MSAAARLQAAGLRTAVLEIHDKPGGCAGYYERDGYAFDIGATTLVDFGPGSVDGAFLDEIGFGDLDFQHLPGYRAWLPGRKIDLHLDPAAWPAERERHLSGSPRHRAFWRLLDRLLAHADRPCVGGAVPCLGVPDEEVSGQVHRHHQILWDVTALLGNGNNMFI